MIHTKSALVSLAVGGWAIAGIALSPASFSAESAATSVVAKEKGSQAIQLTDADRAKDRDDRGRRDRDDDREGRIDLQRARNLARQAAEKANGGVRVYRAEASMHGSASKSPYVDNGDFWTFTFLGGRPGAARFTIETVVHVYKASRRVEIAYNGAIRSTGTTTTSTTGTVSAGGGQSVTLTNGYRVTFRGVSYTSNTSIWRYYVEELPEAQDLSNWVLGLPSCAGVVSASPRGERVNPDPNARISGIKWQPGGGFVQGEFSVTLNGRFAQGSIDVAVKGPDVARGVLVGPSCSRI